MGNGRQTTEAITLIGAEEAAEVWAIVVTYQPDILLLRETLSACRPQVAHLLVVDNGSQQSLLVQLREYCREYGCEILELGDNLGVAAAQNRGIKRAKQKRGTHVLLFDQDSAPFPDMVSQLMAALFTLRRDGVRVAAVGPRQVDRRTGRNTPFVNFRMWGIKRTVCGEHRSMRYVSTDFLISSGSLIPLEVLDAMGLPEEGLFIDNVDMEWCFRVRARGMMLYGVCNAAMWHSVGDQVVGLAGRVIHRHGPLRQYYIMRNRIALYRRSYSPKAWVFQDFFRMLFKLLVFSLFFSPRRQNIRMMFKGMTDGLRGKMGVYR